MSSIRLLPSKKPSDTKQQKGDDLRIIAFFLVWILQCK